MKLQFTNQEQTSIAFTDARGVTCSTSLAAAGDFDSIGDGPTREAVKAFIAAGGVAEPMPGPTAEQVQAQFTADIQKRLDDFAKTRNYDGILSACTYASSTNTKFQSEGAYCVQARDATWDKAYAILAEVFAGTRPMPASMADIESELPVLAWPA